MFDIGDICWFVIEFKSQTKNYIFAISENDINRFFSLYRYAKVFNDTDVRKLLDIMDEEGIKRLKTINETDIVIICTDDKNGNRPRKKEDSELY